MTSTYDKTTFDPSKQPLYKPKRRITQAVFSLLVILIPFFNIIRLDIPTLRFYFFNTVLWVEEFYFLFLFLMLFTWLVLTVSMIYGRVWCGWMCPQMTWVDLTGWFRRKVRKWFKLRSKTVGSHRVIETGLVSVFTAIVSVIIGFNLVSYFVDPFRMLSQLSGSAAQGLDGVTAGFIVGIAILVFTDLMILREVFCNKACPYAMLQMVITDKRTQLVRFQTERADECIDCKACVKICTMGIDIRKSPFQTECTHCGDCVDACTNVLGKLKPPLPSLITFSWGEGEEKIAKPNIFQRLGLFDAKRWVLVTFAMIFFVVLLVLSQTRQPLSVSISGDRSTLYRTGTAGEIINDYVVKITNRHIEADQFKIEPAEGLVITLKDAVEPIELAMGETRKIKLSFSHKGNQLKPGPNRIMIKFRSLSQPERRVTQEIVFFMPQTFEGIN